MIIFIPLDYPILGKNSYVHSAQEYWIFLKSFVNDNYQYLFKILIELQNYHSDRYLCICDSERTGGKSIFLE